MAGAAGWRGCGDPGQPAGRRPTARGRWQLFPAWWAVAAAVRRRCGGEQGSGSASGLSPRGPCSRPSATRPPPAAASPNAAGGKGQAEPRRSGVGRDELPGWGRRRAAAGDAAVEIGMTARQLPPAGHYPGSIMRVLELVLELVRVGSRRRPEPSGRRLARTWRRSSPAAERSTPPPPPCSPSRSSLRRWAVAAAAGD